jgi:hypothetical protein
MEFIRQSRLSRNVSALGRWIIEEEFIETTREEPCFSFLALSCAYHPDGQQIAVSTVDARILFFHPDTGQQVVSIEGKYDFDNARKETDKVTGKKLTFLRSKFSL